MPLFISLFSFGCGDSATTSGSVISTNKPNISTPLEPKDETPIDLTPSVSPEDARRVANARGSTPPPPPEIIRD